MNGVVLGIDGEQFPARLRGGGHDEFASGDEDFFVGERDGAAEGDGLVGSFESHDTDGGGDDDVDAGMGASGEHAFAAVMDGRERREGFFAEAGLEFSGCGGIGNGDKLRAVLFDLREELVEIRAGG